MKLSEARKLWKHYVFQWKENVISGPGEWARELLKRDLKIDRLKTKLSEYTKLADIHEENQSQLMGEIKNYETVVANDQELLAIVMSQMGSLLEWIDDLHSGMYINCVFCGHRYGPDTEEGVMSDVLHEHIAVCPEHSLSEALAEIEQLKKDMEPFMAQITQAKTYTEADPPKTYTVSDHPSSGDMAGEGEKDAP